MTRQALLRTAIFTAALYLLGAGVISAIRTHDAVTERRMLMVGR